MTKEEIMEAIKAWREENEERAAFVLLVDEDNKQSQVVTGKTVNIMAAVAQVTQDEEVKSLIKGALMFGEIHASCVNGLGRKWKRN